MAGQQSQCPVTHPQAYLRNTRVERCGRVKQVVFAAFAAADSVMHGPLSVHTVYLNYSTYFPCVLAVFLMVSLKTSLAWHETKKTRHRETKCKSGIHLPSILASSCFDPLGPCHLIIQQKWKQGKKQYNWLIQKLFSMSKTVLQTIVPNSQMMTVVRIHVPQDDCLFSVVSVHSHLP